MEYRQRQYDLQMPSVGHRPENLALGAVLTTLSFLCVALVSAFGKAAGQYPLLFIAPITVHGGFTSLRTEKVGLHVLRAATGTACWYALFVAMNMNAVRIRGDGTGHRWRAVRDSRQARHAARNRNMKGQQ